MLYQLSYTPAGAEPLERRPKENKRWMTSAASAYYQMAVHAPTTPAIIDPELLLLAYRSGIFPMADSRDDPEIFWVEPKLRAILPLSGFHLSHSLARTLRRGRFRVTCNTAFADVVAACAAPRRAHVDDGETGESWISHRIAASYLRLHELGHAHSIECWNGERLVGGLYGVGVGGAFCGESMFSREADASKTALAALVAALRRGGARLLDCQFMTPHLASLGAVEVPQERYLSLLGEALVAGEGDAVGDAAGEGGAAGAALALPAGFAALLGEAAGSSSLGNFIAQSLTQTS